MWQCNQAIVLGKAQRLPKKVHCSPPKKSSVAGKPRVNRRQLEGAVAEQQSVHCQLPAPTSGGHTKPNERLAISSVCS